MPDLQTIVLIGAIFLMALLTLILFYGVARVAAGDEIDAREQAKRGGKRQ